MPNTLSLLHTAPVLVDTFRALQDELCPEIPIQHLVDESPFCKPGSLTASPLN